MKLILPFRRLIVLDCNFEKYVICYMCSSHALISCFGIVVEGATEI